ncbi:MAG: radical SAM family heme chaperone HemW [Chloroflexota bacterium]
MRGLYIHVPFCVRKCRYCDFYSLPGQLDTVAPYVDAVLRESLTYKGLSSQTMYLGGGTPSLLGAKHLKKLIDGLRESLDLSDVTEATIEVNPDSTTRELLETAKDAGINRVSIGVQSLDDSELQSVGRVHTATQAMDAIKLTKRLGFNAVSADLIVGLPGQTWLTLHNSLERLVDVGIEHLSLYCLSLEEGTPLAESPPDNLPSDDTQAELFEQASRFLDGNRFIHYEISNFALQGFECQHNLIYWHGDEYLGLGPAAASHLDGKRFRNRADLDAYISHPTGQMEDVEELFGEEKAAEEAMLRLRLLEEGIKIDELTAKFGQDNVTSLIARLDGMVRDGRLTYDGSTYRLAPARILTSNPIFADVLC